MDTADRDGRPGACQVRMGGIQRCLRPTYDDAGRCICHSTDPGKNPLAFDQEVGKELAGHCNFTRFVFPGPIDFAGKEFVWNVRFTGAEFRGEASFLGAYFKRDADMSEAVFHEGANFDRACFGRGALFQSAKFVSEAAFRGARFQGNAVLSANFGGDVDFSDAVFGGEASFDGATFGSKAAFASSQFVAVASFLAATFRGVAQFSLARFHATADFTAATFWDSVGFIRATFDGEARFYHMTFQKEAHFVGATFGDAAYFVGEKINVVKDGVPVEPIDNRVFSRGEDTYLTSAVVHQPTRVVFRHVFLGRTRFLGTDVTRLDFADVRWADRPGGHFALRDELGTEDGQRDHELIGRLYRQLKHNYEERRDHITAGDFHVGEMEMRRLAHPPRSPVGRFLRRNLSLLALYKVLSEYGESYTRAFLWIVAVICVFAALTLFPALAIQATGHGATPAPIEAFLPRLLYSAMCFLLRGDRPFESVTLAGHFAAVVEGIVGPALIAIFVLALNRRLKR